MTAICAAFCAEPDLATRRGSLSSEIPASSSSALASRIAVAALDEVSLSLLGNPECTRGDAAKLATVDGVERGLGGVGVDGEIGSAGIRSPAR